MAHCFTSWKIITITIFSMVTVAFDYNILALQWIKDVVRGFTISHALSLQSMMQSYLSILVNCNLSRITTATRIACIISKMIILWSNHRSQLSLSYVWLKLIRCECIDIYYVHMWCCCFSRCISWQNGVSSSWICT